MWEGGRVQANSVGARGGDYAADALFARADTALYAAKRGGRDRCVLADARPAEPTADTPLRTLAG
jgi:diguanylate cyclase